MLSKLWVLNLSLSQSSKTVNKPRGENGHVSQAVWIIQMQKMTGLCYECWQTTSSLFSLKLQGKECKNMLQESGYDCEHGTQAAMLWNASSANNGKWAKKRDCNNHCLIQHFDCYFDRSHQWHLHPFLNTALQCLICYTNQSKLYATHDHHHHLFAFVGCSI